MVLTQPATAIFDCTYELTGRTTVYSWYLDGVLQSGYTASSASIDIPAGDHRVECRANITVDAGCECDDTTAMDITVLGKQYVWLLTSIAASSTYNFSPLHIYVWCTPYIYPYCSYC